MKKTLIIFMIIYYSFIIWSFSSHPADVSAKESKSITGIIYDKIAVHIEKFSDMGKDMFVKKADSFIRKCAHFTLFFIFSLFISLYVNCYGRDAAVFLLTVFLTGVIFAVSDEVHQLFVPGRGCQLRDVLIDSNGVLAGGIIFLLAKRSVSK